jgi:hypothetical protein
MLMRRPPTSLERAGIWPFLGAWLLLSGLLVAANWPAITGMAMPDPDDAMRLLQVRDLLAGQGWFDVTQYRVAPPAGVAMHWSRLVDVPIAALILTLEPLFGADAAERIALIAVPLLTLGAVMWLVARLTERLLTREHALLAALLVPVSVAALHQLRPMRIDHHGWQIVLALAATLSALDPRPKRAGMLCGALAAAWLCISLEALPFTAALAGLFAFRWACDPGERERLVGFALGLAGASFLFFFATRPPAAWTAVHCDALSPPYLAAFAGAALATCAATLGKAPSLLQRFARLLPVGIIPVVAFVATGPMCGRGPFAALDPLVDAIWYRSVLEGLPLWRQTPQLAALTISFPLVGLVGSALAWRVAILEQRRMWLGLLLLLGAASLIAVLVQRAGAVANMLAIPGGAFLIHDMLGRARKLKPMPLRLAATLGAVSIALPGYGLAAIASAGEQAEAGPAGKAPNIADVRYLQRLEPSLIAAPLDIGPAILQRTRHSVVATGHHRASDAMRDTIRIFTSSPELALMIIRRRNVGYLVLLPGLSEPDLYANRFPTGLTARLVSGAAPDWLEEVPLPKSTSLRAWRVRGDQEHLPGTAPHA